MSAIVVQDEMYKFIPAGLFSSRGDVVVREALQHVRLVPLFRHFKPFAAVGLLLFPEHPLGRLFFGLVDTLARTLYIMD